MMHLLLADAPTPNANTVWLVILSLAAVAGNIAMVGQWIAMRKKQEFSPQPLMIAMEKEFATKHELERIREENKKDHDSIFSKIGGVERGAATRLEEQIKSMRTENREDTNELHNKINEARESISGLKSETTLQNQSLASIQSDVKRLLERPRGT